jgi:hypothetical protein
MKSIIKLICILAIVAFVSACEKDQGKLPTISFKTGGNYISSDVTKAGGSQITIGINAAKSESEDVLKKINVSKSVNSAAASTVFEKALSGSEGDNYSYDYTTTLDTISGQTNKFTFTITNRDGLTNQVSLTVTVQ